MPPHGPGFSGALHSHDAEYPDDDWNLYSMLDPDGGVKALNVLDPEDAKGVFKPYARRLSESHLMISDADQEIIITCRFTSPVHIAKMMIIGAGEEGGHPLTMQCYVNKEDINFSDVEDFKPVQVFENLVINTIGTTELFTARQAFTNVNTLTIYITANHSDGDKATTIKYIGMQGEHTHYRREAVDTTYEVLCNGQDITQPEDKKVPDNAGF